MWFKNKPQVLPADDAAIAEEQDDDAPLRAAASIAARIKSISQAETYIRKVAASYGGQSAFETELARLGIAREVSAIIKKG